MSSKPRPAAHKMRAYRERLRALGLKPVQMWVPDVNTPRFKRELRRQIGRLSAADETAALAFIEAVAEDSPHG